MVIKVNPFEIVQTFEQKIGEFYGAPYAVSTDCCTHAIELSLRYTGIKKVTCPSQTYVGIPMTLEKLSLDWSFVDETWEDFYFIGNTNIVDAAVYWKSKSYIPGSFMCLSFQFQKHLNLIRGGAILLDDPHAYHVLKKMSYDGRITSMAWKEQDIDTWGYHYYMTPETAQRGLDKLEKAIITPSRGQSFRDYPYLPALTIFKK
jgi:dTDP-4-amino-4,6-dideoxygalactose transaminase